MNERIRAKSLMVVNSSCHKPRTLKSEKHVERDVDYYEFVDGKPHRL